MNSNPSSVKVTRRRAISTATAATLGAAFASSSRSAVLAGDPVAATSQQELKGRIKQSIVSWCFTVRGEQWSIERVCQVARQLGYPSVELVDPQHFPTLKQNGLISALVGANIQPGPPFMRGFNNPQFQPMVIQATREAIDAAADHGFPSVIAFTGFSAGIQQTRIAST